MKILKRYKSALILAFVFSLCFWALGLITGKAPAEYMWSHFAFLTVLMIYIAADIIIGDDIEN